jgi:hypothetical protein
MANSDRIPDAMKASGGFEDATNFFSSYFHQDWPEEARNPAQIISLFLSEGWTTGYLHQLAEEIRQFTAMHTDDGELERALFSELGSYYVPSADGITARAWLEDVASALETAANDTRM